MCYGRGFSDAMTSRTVHVYRPQSPDEDVAHAPFGVVGLEVAALVGVDDAVQTTFDLDALARLGPQVRVEAQPVVGARHQDAGPHTKK
jgi:hypothetical protein